MPSARAQGEQSSWPSTRPVEWPSTLAGRVLVFSCEEYVIYGQRDGRRGKEATAREHPSQGEHIANWIRHELPPLFERYGKPSGTGFVLLFADEEQPLPGLQYGDAGKAGGGYGTGTGPQSTDYHRRPGRKYSLYPQPYFRESYALTPQPAKLLRDEVELLAPAWICVLATDQYLTEKFDDRYRAHVAEGQRLLQAETEKSQQTFGAIMMAALRLLKSTYVAIDLKLMRLQRRAALATAVLHACIDDDARRARELDRLQREIDAAWEEIYSKRPVE